MIFASKSTVSLDNLKILRHKVMKNLTNLLKKFCEFPPGSVKPDPGVDLSFGKNFAT